MSDETKHHKASEMQTVTLQTVEFRRAVSALANSLRCTTALMEHEAHAGRCERYKLVADELTDGLAALAFGQIRRGT